MAAAVLLLFLTNIVVVRSAWVSYKSSRFNGNVIVPAQLTDENWENGIKRDGYSVLFEYSVARERYISSKTAINCAGQKGTINRVENDWVGGWIVLHFSWKKPASKLFATDGFPNPCFFE